MADGTSENEHVLIRGNHKQPGGEVGRRFLEVFVGDNPSASSVGSGRLELARRMAERSNPLPSRVMVNRLWQHHFGRGIVPTPDNFGRLGQPPSHPELLDYLASEFLRHNWSIKHMQRVMLLSRAYRMSCSTEDPRSEKLDPENRLLHRMPIRRLEGEMIRDAILAVSGRLDRRMFGSGVLPHLSAFMEGRGRPSKSGPLDGAGRRSLYINVRRNFLTPMFLAFDYPTPFSTIGQRTNSNVPAQALTMMNNPFVVEQSQVWAQRVLAQSPTSPAARVRQVYEMAFARPPDHAELAAALEFLAEHHKASGGSTNLRTWADLCHVLMNVKEFVFVY
jgi:hypothetical protein